MNTLILNGSPRNQGDTANWLNVFTAHLSGEYMQIDAYRCDISPCTDCRYCWKQPGCSIRDQMQEVYAYIDTCERVLIASPVYFSELTGPLLSVASRLQTYYCATKFRNQPVDIAPKKGGIFFVVFVDGSLKTARITATILLRQMNAVQIAPLASYHNSNEIALKDFEPGLQSAKGMAEFFNAD